MALSRRLEHLVGLVVAVALPIGGSPAVAADLHVLSAATTLSALKTLAPEFERRSGDRLVVALAPSMGDSPAAVPQRLARKEPADVAIMAGQALDRLVAEGRIVDPVALGRSQIGGAVRNGTPAPDISTVAGLKAAMLAAKTIAVSDSASGAYIRSTMIRKLGIENDVRDKIRTIRAMPVGEAVANGEADLGFHQISELKPVTGITLLGPVPDGVGETIVLKAGIVSDSTHKAEAQALVRFLASPQAASAFRASGMETGDPPR